MFGLSKLFGKKKYNIEDFSKRKKAWGSSHVLHIPTGEWLQWSKIRDEVKFTKELRSLSDIPLATEEKEFKISPPVPVILPEVNKVVTPVRRQKRTEYKPTTKHQQHEQYQPTTRHYDYDDDVSCTVNIVQSESTTTTSTASGGGSCSMD